MNRKLMALVLLAPALALLVGCATTVSTSGPSAGTVYYMGTASKTYSLNLQDTYNGVLDALKDAGVTPYSKGMDSTKAYVTANFSDGKKLSVVMTPIGQGATEVKVRVGTTGDLSRSNFIMDKIAKRLE